MGVLMRPGRMCAAVNWQSNTMWEIDSSSRTLIINKDLQLPWLTTTTTTTKKRKKKKKKKKEKCVQVGTALVPEVPRTDQTYIGWWFLLLWCPASFFLNLFYDLLLFVAIKRQHKQVFKHIPDGDELMLVYRKSILCWSSFPKCHKKGMVLFTFRNHNDLFLIREICSHKPAKWFNKMQIIFPSII